MIKIFLLFLSLTSFLVLAGCGGGSGDGSNDTNSETYTYSYRQQINGSSCETGKLTFKSLNDYCVALTDQGLNKACALDFRKSAYRERCSGAFEETNIGGFYQVSGYDDRIKRNCTTGHAAGRFPRLRDYCEFLKDESLHQSCFWDNRRTEFMSKGCTGDFSGPPPVSGPIVDPKPSPTPVPPSPPHDDRPQVVRDLEAAGIEVKENPTGISNPYEKPFHERVRKFYEVLEQNEGEVLNRREIIRKIRLSEYATYMAPYKHLVLSVDFTSTELREYLRLTDRRVNLANRLGFDVDFGVEVGSFDHGDKLAEFRGLVSYLESQERILDAFKGVVKTLKFDDYEHYYLFSRELQIDKKKYQEDIRRFAEAFRPVYRFFWWAEKAHIEITGDFDVDKNLSQFSKVVSQLDDAKDSLAVLKDLAELKEISINNYSSELSLAGSSLRPAVAAQVLT